MKERKEKMWKCLFLIIVFLLLNNTAFGCSIGLSPISEFEPTHYVFIGKITEIIEDTTFETQGTKGKGFGFTGKALGFKIKVVESIYSPTPSTYYEVFPLRLTADCGLRSDIKPLLEHFSVGSQVRVVASESTIFPNSAVKNQVLRLETSIYNRGSISRNDLSDELRTSPKTFYDYKSFHIADCTDKVLVESNNRLPEFELRKDLLRLKEAKSEAEKIEVLKRLVFYPNIFSFNFSQTIKINIKNQVESEPLENLWQQRVKEFYSK